MSAVFNATTKWLNTTLSTTLLKGDPKFMTAHFRYDSLATHGIEVAMEFGESDDSSAMDLRNRSTNPNLQIDWFYEGDGDGRASTETWVDDTWYACGAFLQEDDGTVQSYAVYQDGVKAASTNSTPNTSGTFDTLLIGGPFGTSSFRMWTGWVAEVAIWDVANVTEADTIISQLWNGGSPTLSDTIAADSPIWYATLETDATVTTGSALTNNGTVTFDAGEHPTLITAGGGGGGVGGGVIFIG